MDRGWRRAVVILVPVLLFVAYVVYNNRHLPDEMPYRTSEVHTYGTVFVTVDGQPMPVTNIPLRYSGAKTEHTTITDNQFTVRRGDQGANLFLFTLPNIAGQNIDIEVYHYNTNWWHVNELTVDIQISTDSGLKASMSGTVRTRSKEGPYESGLFEVPEKTMTEEDHMLSDRGQYAN